jgi:rare lipoprotein A
VRTGARERGLASWYGKPFHGRRTASGEVYDMHKLTAAHRSLPFGTRVRVTRRDSGASVEVRINDRGPFVRGRIIDLSYAAAKRIGLDADGVAPVELRILGHTPLRDDPEPDQDPSTESGCLWVQVGAFGDLGNARRARQRLEDSGEKAVVSEGPGGLNRVRVGPFDNHDRARQALRRVLPDWPPARIVECGQ